MATTCQAAVLTSMCRIRSLIVLFWISQLVHYTHARVLHDHDSESRCKPPQAPAPAGTVLMQMQTRQTTHPQVTIPRDSAPSASQLQQGTSARDDDQHEKSYRNLAKTGRFTRAAEQVPPAQILQDGVALIVPGLGERSRAHRVLRNLAWLKRQGIPFDCWIYAYKSEEEFPLWKKGFEPCKIIRHKGYWMEHVLQMPLNETKMPYVLHLLDGIEPQADVDVKSMYQIMRANELGHAAPTFARRGRYKSIYPIMAQDESYKVGRRVDFIEFHCDLFTRRYFACIQDNIDALNPMGWGMDRLLPHLCGGSSVGGIALAGKLGLLDHMTIEKYVAKSYSWDEAKAEMEYYEAKRPNIVRPKFQVLGSLVPAAAGA